MPFQKDNLEDNLANNLDNNLDQNEPPPILKTWKNLYLLVAGTLFALMLSFYFFMRYFS